MSILLVALLLPPGDEPPVPLEPAVVDVTAASVKAKMPRVREGMTRDEVEGALGLRRHRIADWWRSGGISAEIYRLKPDSVLALHYRYDREKSKWFLTDANLSKSTR